MRVLRTEEVRFREAAVMESILYHMDVGILLAEVDGSVSFATPPVSRLMGVPMRSVVGTRAANALAPVLAQVHAHHPTGEPFRVADLLFVRALQERGPVRGVMMVVERPGGGEAWLEMSATPIWEEGGELAGVIQTLTDRTESAIKTRELTNAQDELRRLQGRLLQRTRAQALGQLASGAAHALNNFLNVVRLRITLLRREFKPEDLDALDRTVGQIGDLVGRLQEFNVQRTEEVLKDVPLDAVVREALGAGARRVGAGSAPGGGGSALVRSGPGSGRRGVLPRAGREPAAVGEGSDGAGRPVGLTTRAEGSEPRDVAHRGRRPAVRGGGADAAVRSAAPGRGGAQAALQLAVVRAQVQRWGGELTVENARGGKSGAFVVRLPRVKAACLRRNPAPRSPVTGPRRFQQTRRVLVVDDDLDNARMMAEVLATRAMRCRWPTARRWRWGYGTGAA